MFFGADDGARTRYLHLGKVALYQMSYTRNNKAYYSRKFVAVKHKMKKLRMISFRPVGGGGGGAGNLLRPLLAVRRLPAGGDRLGIPLVAQGGHLPVREEGVLPAAVRPPGEVQMAIAALGADDVPEVG